MKTTVMGVILELTPEQREFLDSLMKRYCSAVRWGFKRLLEKAASQDIREKVQEMFELNSRQANDAVSEAQAVIDSQHKLVQIHLDNKQRLGFTQKRIAEAKSPRRIANLKRRKDKEERKLAKWQHYFDTKTFPPVVFGSKKLFRERCKGYFKRGMA